MTVVTILAGIVLLSSLLGMRAGAIGLIAMAATGVAVGAVVVMLTPALRATDRIVAGAHLDASAVDELYRAAGRARRALVTAYVVAAVASLADPVGGIIAMSLQLFGLAIVIAMSHLWMTTRTILGDPHILTRQSPMSARARKELT